MSMNDNVRELAPYTIDTGRLPLVESKILTENKEQVKQSFLDKDHVGSVVYGGLDGIITTFVIVLCAYGVDIQIRKIMNIGISSLIANAISMAVSDYVSSKTQAQMLLKQQQRERKQVQKDLQGQKIQMIDIYKKHGLKEKVSSEVVELLSNNKESFIDIMIVEKLGMRAEVGQPIVNSLITFFSFSLLGFIPLIPLIISSWLNFAKKQTYVIVSGILTMVTLFILGFSKSILVKSKWYVSSFQTIFLGIVAALGAFAATRAFGQTIIG